MTTEPVTSASTRLSVIRNVILFFPAFIAISISLHDVRFTLALAAGELGLLTYFVRLARSHVVLQCLMALVTLVRLCGVFVIGSELHG